MTKPERSVYTPQDFLQWRESKSLDLSPKFQRRAVWKSPARSFFIDTLLRQMPVPPIYLRVVQGRKHTAVVREVVDGQQRISAVLDYIDGNYRLSRSLDAQWAGKSFDGLTRSEQQTLLASSFAAELFHGIDDREVLEVFARLNTYSVQLNSQELRNGKYFGYFKQSAYTLAREHLEFWRRHKIVTEQQIARMLEVELTSELVVAQIAGMQDKKKTLDSFYADYDDEYAHKSRHEQRFRRTIDCITTALGDQLRGTAFRRPPFFYTLYCVVYHHLYGMPRQRRHSPRKTITDAAARSLCDAVVELSEHIAAARAQEEVPVKYSKFVAASLSQTDNIKPRQERFNALYALAF